MWQNACKGAKSKVSSLKLGNRINHVLGLGKANKVI